MVERSDNPYLRSVDQTRHELSEARSSGNGWVIFGWLSLLSILGAAGYALWAMFGVEGLLALPLPNIILGLAGAFLLSVLILSTAYLARQSVRTSQANAVVLRASQMLLAPAEKSGKQIASLGQAMRAEAERLDELFETTYASMADIAERLTAERSTFETHVGQNRQSLETMMGRLADERQALAELSSAIDAQSAAMSDALPKHARLMADAARFTQQEVAKADEALDERLKALDEAGKRLGERLIMLDDMARDAEGRTAALSTSISQIEAQLSQSAKTVDSAIRASELATSAASETGDALNAAVASALDGTREASDYIRKQAKEAAAEAMRAMADLRVAGEQAEAATQAAGAAARAQAEETEVRIEQMSELMYRAATRATSAAEAGLDRARQRIERASALLNGLNDSAGLSDAPFEDPSASFAVPPEPVTGLRPRVDEPNTSETSDAPAKPRETDERERDPDLDTPPTPSRPVIEIPNFRERFTLPEKEVNTEVDTSAAEANETDSSDESKDEGNMFETAFDSAAQRSSGLSWKDLLAGLEGDEGDERDQAARYIMNEINEAGADLEAALDAKALKRISGATKRSERHRRRSVRDQAGAAVQKVMFRLQDDAQFYNAAERFVTVEEPDALRALSEVDRTRSAGSPRLAAFLIVDTALANIG